MTHSPERVKMGTGVSMRTAWQRVVMMASFAVVFATAVGCGGDDDDDDGGSSGAIASCHAMCAAQYQDCADQVPTCNQLCDALVPSFSEDCQAKADAYYGCASGVEWECQGLLANQVDGSLCEAEEQAYTACF